MSPGPSADVEGASPGASADGAGVRTDTLDGRLRFIGGGRDVGIFGVQGRVVTEYAANATCSDGTCSDATCSDATSSNDATMQGCNTSHAASSPVETSRKIECCECAGAQFIAERAAQQLIVPAPMRAKPPHRTESCSSAPTSVCRRASFACDHVVILPDRPVHPGFHCALRRASSRCCCSSTTASTRTGDPIVLRSEVGPGHSSGTDNAISH